MFNNLNLKFNNRISIFVLLALCLLVLTNLFVGSFLRENLENLIWESDDVLHVSVANSFRNSFQFDAEFQPSNPEYYGKSVYETIAASPTISWKHLDKGPMYYISLGSFYSILNVQPEDFYFFGSIFTNLLGSLFLILYFILLKNKFDFKIAAFSSILVVLSPWFGWASTRILPYSLLLVFAISALFFLGKNRKHYVLFGVFAGLAHLTHPFGIFLGFSYCIFLLLHKEFKGFLTVFLSWQIILLPWFLRNYYYLQDIGWGLYLPFSNKLSSFLTFLPHQTESTLTNYVGGGFLTSKQLLSPFLVFYDNFFFLSHTYYLDYLVFFILIFSGVAFFKLSSLKNYLKYVLLIILVISFSFFVASYPLPMYSLLWDQNYLQPEILLIFILPPITISLLYIKKKHIFESKLPRFFTFSLLLIFTNLVGLYIWSLVSGYGIATPKQIMFPIILLVPISIIGLTKLIETLSHNKLPKIIPLVILILILLPITFHMVEGISSINNFFIDRNSPQLDNEMKQMNSWLRENVKNEHVISNLPGEVYLRTGLQTIGIPPYQLTEKDFHVFIDNYDVSYMVFYNLKRFDTSFFETMKSWFLSNKAYEEKFTIGNSHIYKILDLSKKDMSEPDSYLKQGLLLDFKEKNLDAKKIFEEFVNYKTDEKMFNEVLCPIFYTYNKFEDSVQRCNQLLQQDPLNSIAFENLALNYYKLEQQEKLNETIKLYHELSLKSNDPKLLKSWSQIMNYLISQDNSYENLTNFIFIAATELEQEGKLEESLNILKTLTYIDYLSINVVESQISILTTFEKYDEVLNVYDIGIEIYENKIMKLRNTSQNQNINEMQKSLINLMKDKAELLINLEDYHKANRVYGDILNINKFDFDVWQKIGSYHEQYGQLRQALHNYEFAYKLKPDNNYLLEKIAELKDRLGIKQGN